MRIPLYTYAAIALAACALIFLIGRAIDAEHVYCAPGNTAGICK
jgi:hypothetical protein